MRFSLVDRITELHPGESISTVKNLTAAEEYLADHFPGFAVMPGVMMVESLVQAGAWLMRVTDDFQFSTITLKQARALKFNHFVTPGETLAVNLKVHKREGSEYTFKAEGKIHSPGGGEPKSAVSARITLEQRNLRDRHPDLKESDETTLAAMRSQLKQLWPAT